MAISAKLELRQGQQLVMTPQLQQAIRLLQLSNLELSEFVNAEVERNPLLERDEAQGGPVSEPTQEPPDSRALPEEREWLDLSEPVIGATGAMDADLSDVYPDTPALELGAPMSNSDSWASVRQRTHSMDEEHNLEAYVSAEMTLKQHLTNQLQLTVLDASERLAARLLIDHVDDTGYLTVDLEGIAERLGAPAGMLEKVLTTLQGFDPPGIFARNLAECLALQLKDRNRYDPQIAALLDNLELIAQHDLAKLRRVLKVDVEELSDMITELKALCPKPGLQFDSGPVETIVADVFVRPAPDGSWIVELNSDTLPRVLVNRSYYTTVSRSAKRPEDKSYLQDCLQTANWLTNSLDQRARTILKVSEEIVRQQDGFFTHGIRHLRPLNLRTVADAINMHESTVSRVTSNKYIATPRGLFELKFFFTSAISSTEDGELHSSESVRHRIKELIDAEPPSAVLSDDALVIRLKDEGIDIARRTVAKYREALRIPSSVQRRREKRISHKLLAT
jgi:RNA polymerase sigma-54 factor